MEYDVLFYAMSYVPAEVEWATPKVEVHEDEIKNADGEVVSTYFVVTYHFIKDAFGLHTEEDEAEFELGADREYARMSRELYLARGVKVFFGHQFVENEEDAGTAANAE